LLSGQATLDPEGNVVGERAQAQQQNVAVLELAGVVVVIGMLHRGPGRLGIAQPAEHLDPETLRRRAASGRRKRFGRTGAPSSQTTF
jgi:hypothetical protein